MKIIILIHLFLILSINSFSQILELTNDNSDDFSIALSNYYLAFNKYNSAALNEEVYIYDLYNTNPPYMPFDLEESYLCDINDNDYILFSFLNIDVRLLYIHDAYNGDYIFIDTTADYNFSKIYDDQVLYTKISDDQSDTMLYLFDGLNNINLGNYGGLSYCDLADSWRAVWAGKDMFFLDGSSIYQMNDVNEQPRACQVSNDAAAWVSFNPNTSDVFVHYINGTTDEVINPDGYGDPEWFSLSGTNLVWLDIRPNKGLNLYNGYYNTQISYSNLPSSSNCCIDNNDIVFGGNGVIYHFDINTQLITTYELGFNRIAQNITLKSGAIAWTENTGVNREVYFALLDDMVVLDERLLETEQHTFKNEFIYPNPTSDILRCNIAENEITPYSIVDMSGKTVMEGLIGTEREINVKALESGIYLLRTKSFNSEFIKK